MTDDRRRQKMLAAAVAVWMLVAMIAGLAYADHHGYRNSTCNARDPIVVCERWQVG